MIIKGREGDEKEVIRAIQGKAPPSSGSHRLTDTVSIIYLPPNVGLNIQMLVQIKSITSLYDFEDS